MSTLLGVTRSATFAPVLRSSVARVELSTDAFSVPHPVKWGEVATNLMPFEPVIDKPAAVQGPTSGRQAGTIQVYADIRIEVELTDPERAITVWRFSCGVQKVGRGRGRT
jgi:hypothetical protein